MIGSALDMVTWWFAWLVRFLASAGAQGYWLALFAASVVIRLFLRPIIGDAVHAPANEKIAKNRKARSQKNKPSKGGD